MATERAPDRFPIRQITSTGSDLHLATNSAVRLRVCERPLCVCSQAWGENEEAVRCGPALLIECCQYDHIACVSYDRAQTRVRGSS